MAAGSKVHGTALLGKGCKGELSLLRRSGLAWHGWLTRPWYCCQVSARGQYSRALGGSFLSWGIAAGCRWRGMRWDLCTCVLQV